MAGDEIVSAIHLQVQYDTADEQVYHYSDWQTSFVLETNIFGSGHARVLAWWWRTHWKHAFEFQAHTHTASYQRLPNKTYVELSFENVHFHTGEIWKLCRWIMTSFTPALKACQISANTHGLACVVTPLCVGRLTLAAEPACTQLSRFYLAFTCDIKHATLHTRPLSQLVQQWKGPENEASWPSFCTPILLESLDRRLGLATKTVST